MSHDRNVKEYAIDIGDKLNAWDVRTLSPLKSTKTHVSLSVMIRKTTNSIVCIMVYAMPMPIVPTM